METFLGFKWNGALGETKVQSDIIIAQSTWDSQESGTVILAYNPSPGRETGKIMSSKPLEATQPVQPSLSHSFVLGIKYLVTHGPEFHLYHHKGRCWLNSFIKKSKTAIKQIPAVTWYKLTSQPRFASAASKPTAFKRVAVSSVVHAIRQDYQKSLRAVIFRSV